MEKTKLKKVKDRSIFEKTMTLLELSENSKFSIKTFNLSWKGTYCQIDVTNLGQEKAV